MGSPQAAESHLPPATEAPDDEVYSALRNGAQKSRQMTWKCVWGVSGTVVEKSFSNQKVASSIPCRSVLEQDTEPLIAPDVQCAISVKM